MQLWLSQPRGGKTLGGNDWNCYLPLGVSDPADFSTCNKCTSTIHEQWTDWKLQQKHQLLTRLNVQKVGWIKVDGTEVLLFVTRFILQQLCSDWDNSFFPLAFQLFKVTWQQIGTLTYDLVAFHLSRPVDSVSLKALPTAKEFIHNPPFI